MERHGVRRRLAHGRDNGPKRLAHASTRLSDRLANLLIVGPSGWLLTRLSAPFSAPLPTAFSARRASALGAIVLTSMLLASMLLSACASTAQITQAHANKTKLDQELSHARTDLAIPDRLLTPITSQEAKVASGDGGILYNYDDAATQYDALYNQLLGIEKTALTTLQQQAQQDLQTFASLLNERKGEGFVEVDAYQQRYDDLQKAFTDAKTPNDFAHVSDLANVQTSALQALWPAYQKLQDLQGVLKALQDAQMTTQLAQQFYDQDLQVFRDAASADRYQALASVIDAQVAQLLADQATGASYLAAWYLQQFQSRIDLLSQYEAGFKSHGDLFGQYGGNQLAPNFQKQHDDDATQLNAAVQLKDYLALDKTIADQSASMNSPLLRAKTLFDYTQLDTLVKSVANRTIINKQTNPRFYPGKAFPLAYEYMGENGLLDNDMGIGPASAPGVPGKYARTDADYQRADFRITSLQANLRAMLDNYDPATDEVDATSGAGVNPVHEQPHKSDLQLMQYYHVMSGKVIVISLREQVARFFQDGQMVGFSYVTTGDPDVTSVPGFWTAINRHSPGDPNTCDRHPNTCPPGGLTVPPGFGDLFVPPIPGEYNPTPVHFDIAYHEFGFWLHDAYWRHQFGPETNLPHYDPNAFSSGSHGCINISWSDSGSDHTQWGWSMEKVYDWTPLGTPIILY